MLIKIVFEVEPLKCQKCGGQMKIISFIEKQQSVVIEKILKHCGLWKDKKPRPPPEITNPQEVEFEDELKYDYTFFDFYCA